LTIPLHLLRKFGDDVFNRFIDDQELKITYSQLGEDCVLFELLINRLKVTHGYYIDLGCFHPRKYSNTFILTLLGWSGLNVDASHSSIEQFRKERSKDVNVWCGIVGPKVKDEELDYYLFDPPAASTLSASQAEIWQRHFKWRLIEVTKVKVLGINELLETYVPDNKQIDYLNIDIEGLDEQIILAIDFTKYKPRVISVEIHFADLTQIAQNQVFQRLLSEGYKIFAVVLMTYIFYIE
jgi:hypothetical protein